MVGREVRADVSLFTNNVRLVTQTGHVRACAHAAAAAAAAAAAHHHHHHHHPTSRASGSFVSVAAGPRACERQGVGRACSKAQSSSTPCTYVKNEKPQNSLKSIITNLPDPRDIPGFVFACVYTHSSEEDRHHHHHQTTRPSSNRLVSVVPGLCACCGSQHPLQGEFNGTQQRFTT